MKHYNLIKITLTAVLVALCINISWADEPQNPPAPQQPEQSQPAPSAPAIEPPKDAAQEPPATPAAEKPKEAEATAPSPEPQQAIEKTAAPEPAKPAQESNDDADKQAAMNLLAFLRSECAKAQNKDYAYKGLFGGANNNEIIESLAGDLDSYMDAYGALGGADEALMLKSGLYRLGRQHEAELITLLTLVYSYPESSHKTKAETSVRELLADALKRDYKPDSEITNWPSKDTALADRLISLIERASKLERNPYRPHVMRLLDDFLKRHATHRSADYVISLYADYLIADKHITSAASKLNRLITIYDKSALRPAAMLKLGGLYENDLKNPTAAVAVYSSLMSSHPDAKESLTAADKAARIYYAALKNYPAAVDSLEWIIKKAPKTPDALNALLYLASIAAEKADYAKQIDYLDRIAKDFKPRDEAADAIMAIAETYETKIKDSSKAIAAYERIINEYPNSKHVAKATKQLTLLKK